MCIRTIVAGLSLAVASTVAGGALAQEDATSRLLPQKQVPWEARIAYRGAYLESPGYNPFSTNDYFSQITLGASHLIVARGRFAMSAGAQWDYGASGGTARGQSSSLDVHRLTAPLTVRYSLFDAFDVLATVAPGAAYQSASVQDVSAPAPLVARAWVPCGDASGGVAWAFAATSIGRVPFVFRLLAEAGYAWAGPMSLSLSPDLASGDPRRTGATDLGELSTSGGFGRLGLAVAFGGP